MIILFPLFYTRPVLDISFTLINLYSSNSTFGEYRT